MSVGQHLLLECSGLQAFYGGDELESLLRRAATAGGATVLFSHFHPFGEGMGVTGVLVLAESHITVHTWPERGYAAFDIFMCGACQARRAAEVIMAADPDARFEWRAIERTPPSEQSNLSTQSIIDKEML